MSDLSEEVPGRISWAGGELLEVDGTGHGDDGHLRLDEEDADQQDLEVPQSLVPRPSRSCPCKGWLPGFLSGPWNEMVLRPHEVIPVLHLDVILIP